MANNAKFTKATVYWNGRILTMESSVNVRRMSGSQAVNTSALGYAGESPGSPRIEITVSNAVPIDDFEMNPGPSIQNGEDGEITVIAAGKALTSQGTIIDDTFSHAVDSPSKLDFTFRGQMADWT